LALCGARRENGAVTALPGFTEVAALEDPGLDVLSLALAAEFRSVDAPAALAALDGLGAQVRHSVGESDPPGQVRACVAVLAERHGFAGDRDEYDHPDNSMLDLVLTRRRGLPILLSVLYVEVARRAGVRLAGVGLPGHYVVGHFGADPPLLLDPFNGGAAVEAEGDAVRPWSAHETALRMLNNLVGSYERRGDLARSLRAAEMRLSLPAAPPLRDALRTELRAMQARLN
jgi:regulator of sirC expression with transglutaminase-like and TPR domain